METKKKALAEYLECSVDDLEQANFDANLFENGMESYLVLTDAEADEYAHKYILDGIWAFNADFILSHSRIDLDNASCEEEAVLESIKTVQEKLCESANPLLLALLEDEEEFISDAIEADGRGHFLSHYDGTENEVSDADETFYIYRQN
jgi:hypothetical protein